MSDFDTTTRLRVAGLLSTGLQFGLGGYRAALTIDEPMEQLALLHSAKPNKHKREIVSVYIKLAGARRTHKKCASCEWLILCWYTRLVQKHFLAAVWGRQSRQKGRRAWQAQQAGQAGRARTSNILD